MPFRHCRDLRNLLISKINSIFSLCECVWACVLVSFWTLRTVHWTYLWYIMCKRFLFISTNGTFNPPFKCKLYEQYYLCIYRHTHEYIHICVADRVVLSYADTHTHTHTQAHKIAPTKSGALKEFHVFIFLFCVAFSLLLDRILYAAPILCLCQPLWCMLKSVGICVLVNMLEYLYGCNIF